MCVVRWCVGWVVERMPVVVWVEACRTAISNGGFSGAREKGRPKTQPPPQANKPTCRLRSTFTQNNSAVRYNK